MYCKIPEFLTFVFAMAILATAIWIILTIGQEIERSAAIRANVGYYKANPTNGHSYFVYTNNIPLTK